MPELYPVSNAYTFVPEPGENLGLVIKEHGPFYFFNPAMAVHRVDQRDSTPHIRPCQFTSCVDSREWHLAENLMEGRMTVVGTQKRKDPVGNVEEWAAVLKPAGDIVESILETYGDWGVIEVAALRNKPAEELRLDILNSLIYPVTIEPSSILDEVLNKQVQEKGGLSVRQDFFLRALQEVSHAEFAHQFGSELQAIYKAALEESLPTFHRARNFFMGQLTESDSQVQLGQNGNVDGKATYDEKDRYMQWLLARRPTNEMLTQIAGRDQTPIVVNVPPQQGGLTKEDLTQVLTAVLEAAQKPARKPIPSIIKKTGQDA